MCGYGVDDIVTFFKDGKMLFGKVIRVEGDELVTHSGRIYKQHVYGKAFGTISAERLYNTDKETLDNYFGLYQDPNVTFLRTALNAYLAHDSSQACILQAAVTKHDEYPGMLSGLDAFDPSYYSSKFVVYRIGDNSKRGKDIQIIFQDRPDRIFYAWVGEIPTEKRTCLIGFNSQEPFTAEDMEPIMNAVGPFIFDKEHSI